jgi:Tol biopolymer transport system component
LVAVFVLMATSLVAPAPASALLTFGLEVIVDGDGPGTVTSEPAGIECSEVDVECFAEFDESTVVTLTATPGSNAVFAGWSESCAGTQPTCLVTMTEFRSVIATFDAAVLDVTVEGDGVGTVASSPAGIDCEFDCSEAYMAGTVVTLTATPEANAVFAGWTGPCTGTGTCEVTMNGDIAITATFDTANVTVTKAGDGSGTISSSPAGIDCGNDCTEPYLPGTTVTLTALPAAMSVFVGWSGACTGTGACVIAAASDASVTATFDTARLVVAKAGDGGGTVSSSPAGIACGTDCTESYLPGTTVTLTAVPSVNAVFVGWSGACTGTGTCDLPMTTDASVTATFDTATLSVTRAGLGAGTVTSTAPGINCGLDCSESYLPGTTVTLTAAPSAGGTFSGWSGACSGAGPCVLTMSTDLSVVATFLPAGVNGKIVYDCALDICVVNEDGTGLVNLTNSPEVYDIHPVWSPDGTRIAFASSRTSVATNTDGNIEIFVMSADGSNVVQQTFTTTGLGQFVNSYEPSWNPAGTQIVFEGWRAASGFPQIITINVDGNGNETVLTDTADFGSKFSPDWSPDGTKILFTWALGQQDIHVINADGSQEANLTPDTLGSDQRGAVWSPDGARFAFTDTRFWSIPDYNTEIFVRNADGTGEVQVTDHPSIDEEPSWSPDGTEIAFSSARGGSYDIWSIPAPPAGGAFQLMAEPTAIQITSGPNDDTSPNWFGSNTTPTTVTLTVTKAGTGSGTVRSTPAGISCGSDCTEAYTSGTSVTLTARAGTGSTFSGWSGACTGSGACVVSMAETRSVTAIFNSAGTSTFTLTVAKAGTGSGTVTSSPVGINCGTDCSEGYASGTSVALTAAPGTGSTFSAWSGACTGSGACVVSMTQTRSVTATFTTTGGSTFTLTVTKAGTGSGTVRSTPAGISCGSDCTEAYTSGTSVTLTARAGTGSTFSGWSGACTGSGACVVSMAETRSVTAIFNSAGTSVTSG